MRRLLVLDVDGTLLTYGESPGPGLHAALAALPPKWPVWLATGRRLGELLRVLPRLSWRRDVAVLLNGTLTVDLKRRHVLSAHQLSVDLERLWERAEASGLLAAAVFPTATLPDLFGSAGLLSLGLPGYGGLRRRPLAEACYMSVYGAKAPVLAWAAEASQVDAVRVYSEWERPGLFHAELTPTGVDKQVAVSRLSAAQGYAPAQVVAVGDADNDLALLRWAGLGVAMGNGTEAIQSAADLVIGRVEEGGLAAFLHQLARGEVREAAGR